MAQGIFVELAIPDDPFLDVCCCGQARVDQYFRSHEWMAEKIKGGSLTTVVFRAGEAYAASVMASLEERARSKSSCVALKLWVRSTNGKAIGFSTKVGFVTDPAGPFRQDAGDPMLTMRKCLR